MRSLASGTAFFCFSLLSFELSISFMLAVCMSMSNLRGVTLDYKYWTAELSYSMQRENDKEKPKYT